MASPDIEIIIGAEYTGSSEKIKQDISKIVSEISKSEDISIVLGLNETQTFANIKSSLDDMMVANFQDYVINIDANIANVNSVQSTLQSLSGQAVEVPISFDIENADKTLNSFVSQVQQTSTTINIDINKDFLDEFESYRKGLEETFKSQGFELKEVDYRKAGDDLKEYTTKVVLYNEELQKSTVILGKYDDTTKKISETSMAFYDNQGKINDALAKQTNIVSSGQSALNNLQNTFSKLGIDLDTASEGFSEFNDLLKKLEASETSKEVIKPEEITKVKELQKAIELVTKELTALGSKTIDINGEKAYNELTKMEDSLRKINAQGIDIKGIDTSAIGAARVAFDELFNRVQSGSLSFEQAQVLIDDYRQKLVTATQTTNALKTVLQDTKEMRSQEEALSNLITKLVEYQSANQKIISDRGLEDKFKTLKNELNSVFGGNVLVDVKSLGKEFENLEKQTEQFKTVLKGEFSLSNFEQSLKKAGVEIDETSKDFAEFVSLLEKSQNQEILSPDEINRFNELQTVMDLAAKGLASFAGKTIEINGEKANNDLSKMEKLIENINARGINIQGIDTSTIEDARNKFDDLFKSIQGGDNSIESIRTKTDALKDAMAKATQTTTALNDAVKNTGAIEAQEKAITKLKNELEKYYESNKKIAKDSELKTSFGELKDSMENAISAGTLTNVSSLETQFNTLKKTTRDLGLEGATTGEKIKSALSNFGIVLTASALIREAISVIRSMVKEVQALDDAMTELRKVTDETDETYGKFMESAKVASKEVGGTISDFVSASADFARLGHDLGESQELAKAATVYKNVGDGIKDINEATTVLISTMKAFGLEADESMSIVDKFNKIGNEFAISSQGIGEALRRSGSSLAATNNTLEESIGLIVAANASIQDAAVVGTALKSLSLRLTNTAGQLEELGIDADGAAESITKLQTQLLNLTQGKVDIMLDNETFKSTTQILTELSEVWGDLDNVTQQTIVRLVAGQNQANVFNSIMANMGDALEATEKAMDAQGSALEENEKQLESITGKIASFNNAFQSLSETVMSSNVIKWFIDLGTNALIALEKIIDTIGILPIMIPIAIVAIGSLIGILNTLSVTTVFVNMQNGILLVMSGLASFTGMLAGATTTLGTVTVASGGFAVALKTVATAIGANIIALGPLLLIPAAIIAVIGVFDLLTTSVKEQTEKVAEATERYKEATSALEGIETELGKVNDRISELREKQGTSGLTFIEQGELEKLEKVTKELEIQKDIAQKKAELEAVGVAKETVELYDKKYGSDFSQATLDLQTYNATLESSLGYLSKYEDNIVNLLAAHKTLTEAKQEAFDEGLTDKVAFYDEKLRELEISIWDTTSDLGEMKTSFESLPLKEGSVEAESVANRIGLINDAVKLVYTNLDPQRWKEKNFSEIFGKEKYAEITEELKKLAEAGQLTEETFSDPDFSGFVGEMADVGISIQDVINQIIALNGQKIGVSTDGIRDFVKIQEEITNKTNLLSRALAESNTTQGLSVETQRALVAQGEEWASLLTNQDGKMVVLEGDVQSFTNALVDKAYKMALASDATQDEIDALLGLGEALSSVSFSSALAELSASMDLVSQAEIEMSANGEISIGTLQKLADAGIDYQNYLDTSTGKLKLNTSALRDKINSDIDAKIAIAEHTIEQNKNTIDINRNTIAHLENEMAIARRRGASSEVIAGIKTERDELEKQNDALIDQNVLLGENVENLNAAKIAVNNMTEHYKSLNSEIQSNVDKLRKAQEELITQGRLSSESLMYVIEKYPELIDLIGDTEALQAALREKELKGNEEIAINFGKMIDAKLNASTDLNTQLESGYNNDLQKFKDVNSEKIADAEQTTLNIGNFWSSLFSKIITGFSELTGLNFGGLFSGLTNLGGTASGAAFDSSSISDLHPAMQLKANAFLAEAQRRGYNPKITQTLRSNATQEKYYAQGRTMPGDIITYARAGESYHNYGLAFDVSNMPDPEIGDIAKMFGMEWGGDFKDFYDSPHVQMKGININDLKSGKHPLIAMDTPETQQTVQEIATTQGKYTQTILESLNADTQANITNAQEKADKERLDKAKKAADDKIKATKEAADAEISLLEYKRDKGEITEQEFVDQRAMVNEKYYADVSELQDEYRKLEIATLKDNENLYKQSFETKQKNLKYQLDSGMISEESYYNQLRTLNDDYFKGVGEISENYYGKQEQYLYDYNSLELQIIKGLQKVKEQNYANELNQLDKQLKLTESTEIDQLEQTNNRKIEIYKEMQDEAHQIAQKYRELGFEESSNEIREQQIIWRDLQDSIQATNLEILNLDYSNHMDKNAKAMDALNYELQLLGENQVDERMKLVTEQLKVQTDTVQRDNIQLKLLQQAYSEGKISASDFKSETDRLTKSMQDGVLAAKQYSETLMNIQMQDLSEQRDALSAIIDLTKNLIQQDIDDQVEASKKIVEGFQDQKKAQEKLIKLAKEELDREKDIAKERKDSIQEALDAEKELADAQKKALTNELNDRKEIVDAKKKAIADDLNDRKKVLDTQKKAISKELDAAKELADAKKDAIADELDATKELADAKKDAIADELNDRKKLVDLQKKTIEDELDVAKELADAKKDAIADELDAAKELLDTRKKAIEDELKDRKKLVDLQKKTIDDELTAEKKLADEKKKAIEDEIKAEKELADIKKGQLELELETTKKVYEQAKKDRKEDLDYYKLKIDAQKKSLDLQKEDRTYRQTLTEKQKDITDIQDRLTELRNNDSRDAIAERLRLEEQLAEKTLDLENFLFETDIQNQKDALDEEWERYSRLKESEQELDDDTYKIYEETQKAKIKLIDDEYNAFKKAKDQEKEDIQNGYNLFKELKDQEKKDIQEAYDLLKELRDLEKEEMQAQYDAFKKLKDQEKQDIQDEYNAFKKAKDKEKKDIQEAYDLFKELKDQEKEDIQDEYDLFKKLKDQEKDDIQDEYDLFKKLKDQQKEDLQDAYDLYKELKDKEKDDIQDEYDAFKKASDKKKEDIQDAYDLLKKNADNEKKDIDRNLKAYEDMIELKVKGYESEKENIDLLIEAENDRANALKESISNNGELTRLAMQMIDEEGEALYQKLIDWNQIYGTGIDEDIRQAWERADKVMQNNVNTLETMVSLMQNIYQLSKDIADAQYSLNAEPTGIRDYFTGLGKNVGWDAETQEFSIDGMSFSSAGYANIDDRLYATSKQLEEIEKLLANVPKYQSGTKGRIKKTTLAEIHGGEIVTNPTESTHLINELPQMRAGIREILNFQDRMLDSLTYEPVSESVSSFGNYPIKIDIVNSISVDGIATNDIVNQLDSKLERNNRVLTDKIQNDISRNLLKNGISKKIR